MVFEVPEVGRVGLSIGYDNWFPEVARHLAWMGADPKQAAVAVAPS